MKHERFVPMEYANEELMNELNEFMACVKVHLFKLPVNKPKPSVQDIDYLMWRLMEILKQDAKPMIKY